MKYKLGGNEMAVVRLKKGEGRMLKAGGAWIYDNLYEYECRWGDCGSYSWFCDWSNYALLYWLVTSKRAIGADCKWKDRKSPAFKTG